MFYISFAVAASTMTQKSVSNSIRHREQQAVTGSPEGLAADTRFALTWLYSTPTLNEAKVWSGGWAPARQGLTPPVTCDTASTDATRDEALLFSFQASPVSQLFTSQLIEEIMVLSPFDSVVKS